MGRMRLEDLPPMPPGALGWMVYSGLGKPTFAELVADSHAVEQAGAVLADQVEDFLNGAG
jgi:hypothetical protein